MQLADTGTRAFAIACLPLDICLSLKSCHSPDSKLWVTHMKIFISVACSIFEYLRDSISEYFQHCVRFHMCKAQLQLVIPIPEVNQHC